MIAPLLLAAAAFVAGHPTQVTCDAPVSYLGLTAVGGDRVRLGRTVCDALAAGPAAPGFARGAAVLVHESAHARGVRKESCAQTWVLARVDDVLELVWQVPRGSQLGNAAKAFAGAMTGDYLPQPCAWPDPAP